MLKCVTTVLYWRLGYTDWGTPIEEFVHPKLQQGKLRLQGRLSTVTGMRAYPARGYVQVDYDSDDNLVGERFIFDGLKVLDFVESLLEIDPKLQEQVVMDTELARVSIHLAFRTVAWLYADVWGDWEMHEKYLDKGSQMFGAKGATKILAFKKNFITHFPAYELEGPMYFDAYHRTVTAPFECLIPHKRGKGVDVLQWNKKVSKLEKVEAIRYA